MKEALVEAGYPASNIIVAPDAVDINMFDIRVSKKEARARTGLPADKYIVLYTGAIDEPWKGVGVLYDAAKQLSEDYLCVIVGGKPHYVGHFNSLHPPLSNFLLVGHRPHNEIPLYMAAADVLVLPNSAEAEISRVATSPMKLFEYMASGRPIVASDLPSIREILNNGNALLVAPDDSEALASGIQSAVANPNPTETRVAESRKDVSAHTWDNRATAVAAFIDHA